MNYLDIASTLHTRGIDIDFNEYLFALMVTGGEDKEVAYAIAFEPSEFKKNMGEDENEYISSKKQETKLLVEKQNVKMLLDIMSDIHRADIQAQALGLTDFRFSGEQTVQILNNLLKTRIDDIESSSAKDVVAIINALTEQGALDTGDGGFSKHFVQIFPKFNALCVRCGREIDVFAGMDCICPHCRQVYRWVEEEHRFYPQTTKL